MKFCPTLSKIPPGKAMEVPAPILAEPDFNKLNVFLLCVLTF